jgi:spermidine/putrescine transport system substrate-binding protein
MKLNNVFLTRLCIIAVWIITIFSILFWPNVHKNSKKTQILNVFSWSDILSQDVLDDFEKETGIKVNVYYYSSNEELLLKLKNGKVGQYDLIMPSDYAVEILAKENFLKPLNKEKLLFLKDINPLLLGHHYDPHNEYSLPLQWDIYGFGIDKEVFTTQESIPSTWDHLFNEDFIHYKLAMTNDPVEAFCLASTYLFGHKDALNHKEALAVKNLLIEQKKHIEAYAVPRSDYVLGSRNAALALTLSAYILRSKEYFHFIKFVTPKDKTFISIENIALPRGDSSHEKEVYTFLNFLYQPENLSRTSNAFGVFPATLSSIDYLKNKEDLLDIQNEIQKEGYELLFFKHLLPEKEIRRLWVEIKS